MEPWSHEFGGEGSFPLLARTRAALMPLLLPSLQKCMTKTFIYGLTANSRAFQNYSFYRSARIVQNTKNNPPPFLSLRLIVCSLIILQDSVHCFSTKVNLTQRVTFCTLIQFEKFTGQQKYICEMVLDVFPYESQLTLFQQLCILRPSTKDPHFSNYNQLAPQNSHCKYMAQQW